MWTTSWLHLTIIIVPHHLCFWSVRVLLTGDMASYPHWSGTHVLYSQYHKTHWWDVKLHPNKQYKALHNLAPTYLANLLHYYNPPRSLHSAGQDFLTQPKIHTKKYGSQTFACAAPTVFNSLPIEIHQSHFIYPQPSYWDTWWYQTASLGHKPS